MRRNFQRNVNNCIIVNVLLTFREIKLQLHNAIYRLRFYSNSLIHILSLSTSHNNVASTQKNRGDKSHRVIVALQILTYIRGSRSSHIFVFFYQNAITKTKQIKSLTLMVSTKSAHLLPDNSLDAFNGFFCTWKPVKFRWKHFSSYNDLLSFTTVLVSKLCGTHQMLISYL